MRTKTILLITAIFFSLTAKGQGKVGKLDFRVGWGVSLLGTGDMVTVVYENELNYKINNYLTSSLSINLGRSTYGLFETTSFTQGNLNIYLSPFKNNKRTDFRIGTGLTEYSVSDAYIYSQTLINGQWIYTEYQIDTRSTYGLNFVIERSSLITDKLLVGVKLYTQPYFNGDINTGILVKMGFKI
jgi:hypothetical protein